MLKLLFYVFLAFTIGNYFLGFDWGLLYITFVLWSGFCILAASYIERNSQQDKAEFLDKKQMLRHMIKSNLMLLNLEINVFFYQYYVAILAFLRNHTDEDSNFHEQLNYAIDRSCTFLETQAFEFEKEHYRARPISIASGSNEVKKDEAFMTEIISVWPQATEHLDDSLQNDTKFMMGIIEKQPEAMAFLGKQLQQNYRFLLKAFDSLKQRNVNIKPDELIACAKGHTKKELEAAFWIRSHGEEINDKVHIIQQRHMLEMKLENQ